MDNESRARIHINIYESMKGKGEEMSTFEWNFDFYISANINLYISGSQTMRPGGAVTGEKIILVA